MSVLDEPAIVHPGLYPIKGDQFTYNGNAFTVDGIEPDFFNPEQHNINIIDSAGDHGQWPITGKIMLAVSMTRRRPS